MGAQWRIGLACLLLLASAAVMPQQPAPPAGQESGPLYPIQRLVRYSFTLRNDTGQPIEQSALTVYAPVRLTSTQRAGELRSSLPAQVTSDPWGNQQLRIEAGLLPPYASRVVTGDAHVAR